MLTNCSLSRSAHSLLLALFAALALTALLAGSASATVTPDQAFGENGVVSLPLDAPFDSYAWDGGTALQDGSVAFMAARGRPRSVHREPVIRIIRSDGTIDRGLGPKYRIPFPAWSRAYFLHRNVPSVVARQSDGKLLLGGSALIPAAKASKRCGCKKYRRGWFVLRLLKSGARDQSFARNGVALVNDGGLPRKREALVATAPKEVALDRRGGILLYGEALGERSGAILVRLKVSGARDRAFRSIVEDPAIVPQSSQQLATTQSGEIVTVRAEYRKVETVSPSAYGVTAVINRYSASGKHRSTQRAPLPGIGSSGSCNGKCGPSYPGVNAKVLPTGELLIVGGASYGGPSPGAYLTKVRRDGSLDPSFGSDGDVVLPGQYEHSSIGALSARSDGEIWAMITGVPFGPVERRLVKFKPNGEIIRPQDGSIGESLPQDPNNYTYGFEFVEGGLMQHELGGVNGAELRPLVVRRWKLNS